MTSIASIASQDWQTNPTFGDVKYKTLFGSDPQDANAPIAMGYARLEAGQELGLHHHDDAEFYFCTRGSAMMRINDTLSRVEVGMTIYIPGVHCMAFMQRRTVLSSFMASQARRIFLQSTTSSWMKNQVGLLKLKQFF